MTRTFDIHYNDGAYYGTVTFTDNTQEEIERAIQEEINGNNAYMDKYADHTMYHISRKNFKEGATMNGINTKAAIERMTYKRLAKGRTREYVVSYLVKLKEGTWKNSQDIKDFIDGLIIELTEVK